MAAVASATAADKTGLAGANAARLAKSSILDSGARGAHVAWIQLELLFRRHQYKKRAAPLSILTPQRMQTEVPLFACSMLAIPVRAEYTPAGTSGKGGSAGASGIGASGARKMASTIGGNGLQIANVHGSDIATGLSIASLRGSSTRGGPQGVTKLFSCFPGSGHSRRRSFRLLWLGTCSL